MSISESTTPDAARLVEGGPYARAALQYFDAGWMRVLPLRLDVKVPYKAGRHGKRETWQPNPITRELVAQWVQEFPAANIGVGIPFGVIGIDIDGYGAKRGWDSYEWIVDEVGEPLPPTWASTAREYSQGHILFFRVPADIRWKKDIAEGIELIHPDHRYAQVWPSIHPDIKTMYRWYGPDGFPSDRIPELAELAELPESWLAALWARASASGTSSGALAGSRSAVDLADPDRVDREVIMSGDPGNRTQREALLSLIASMWTNMVKPDPVLVKLACYQAIENFTQKRPDEPWTQNDVNKLVDHWTNDKAPGRSSDFDLSLSPSILGFCENIKKKEMEDEEAELTDSEKKAIEFEHGRRFAKRALDAKEQATLQRPRIRRTAREYGLVPQPESVIAQTLAAEVNLLAGPSELFRVTTGSAV